MTEKHILDLLREQKLKKLERSANYAQRREDVVTTKADAVKRIINGQSPVEGLSINACKLRDLYYDRLRAYRGESHSFDTGLKKAGIRLWNRVEKAWEASEIEPERFIKAQFAFFDKAFGKSPEISQLGTDAAVQRAREFDGLTQGRVLSNGRKAPVTKADAYRESEKMMQSLMRAHNISRQEVYETFILTNLLSFPKEFMDRDPAYIAAKGNA